MEICRMLAQFEKISFAATSFYAYERTEQAYPFLWHYHPEFELTLITESEGKRMVGDSICDYRPGDLVLLGPNLPHTYWSWPAKTRLSKPQRAIVIQFKETFLGDHFFGLPEMKSVSHMFQRSATGLAFGSTETGKNVANYLREIPSLPPARRLILLLSVLVELAAESKAKPISTTTLLPLCRVEDQRRVDQICSHLNQTFDQETDFTELARMVHMSQAGLCRFFRRATGRTMTAYINQLRIGAAAQLLANSDMSVLEIGFRVGYGNYSNFNRQFRRIRGVTPKPLRREFYETGEGQASLNGRLP
jgi:AraC-like DNA-binding protein